MRGSSSTRIRPLAVSMTSRFSGAMVRQSAGAAVWATAGAAVSSESESTAAVTIFKLELSLDLGPDRSGDGGADETVDRAVQAGDLLDQPRGDRLMPRVGHQEDRLDVGIEALVHRRHLELVFEVRDSAQSAHDDAGVQRLGEMHQ